MRATAAAAAAAADAAVAAAVGVLPVQASAGQSAAVHTHLTACTLLPSIRSFLGAEPERKYFGKVADATPQDTMLLTLGCGKFRFYDQ